MYWLARRWKTPKVLLALILIEFAFTIAGLALFGIADPDLYRTRLWQDGSDNGFNSNPNQLLYDYANYRPAIAPLVWSQWITNYNVIISVLSMFILLVKATLFVMHIWYPILALAVNAFLCALWAVSVHAQVSPDMSDPDHPQPGAPWYITKSCSVVHNQSNYGYCEQAKGAFAVTVVMLYALPLYLSLPQY